VTTWSGRTRAILVLAGITALAVVVALAGFVVHAVSSSGDGDSSARETVTSRATDFAIAYNTYDVANLASYQRRVKGLLTPAYDKEFVKVTDAVFKALKGKKQKSADAKVLAVAIDDIDKDSADVLVAVDATITNTDNAASVLRHFRWKMSFTKSKGEWRVSTFESVAAVPASAGTPSPSPSSAGDS
jgi:hypothetical protein